MQWLSAAIKMDFHKRQFMKQRTNRRADNLTCRWVGIAAAIVAVFTVTARAETLSFVTVPEILPRGLKLKNYSPLVWVELGELQPQVYTLKYWLLTPTSYDCASSVWCRLKEKVDRRNETNTTTRLGILADTDIFNYPEFLWVARLYDQRGIEVANVERLAAATTRRPPVLGKVRNRVATVGENIDFQLLATEKNGDPIVFSGSYLTHGETLDEESGRFQWTPTSADVGRRGIVFTASQTGLEPLYDSALMAILVRPDRQKPLVRILAPGRQVVIVGDSVTVHGVASDNVGIAKIEFMVENSAGSSEFQTATGLNNWTARAIGLVNGVNTVRIRATDINGNVSRLIERSFVVELP